MTDPTFASLIRAYLDLRWHIDPVDATYQGIPGHGHRLGVFDSESMEQHVAALRSLEAAFEEIELEGLDDEIDRTAVLNEIRTTVHQFRNERPYERNPARWLEHLFDGLFTGEGDGSEAERLDLVPEFLLVAQETLVDCPSVFVDTALRMVDGSDSLVEGVLAQAKGDSDGLTGIGAKAKAALQSFAADLRARPPVEGGFDVGLDNFEHRIRFEHAANTTAAAVWSYGVELIKRTEQELATAARSFVDTGSWQDVASRMRADGLAGDVLDTYQGEVDRAHNFVVERDLAPMPDQPLEVVPTPPFLSPLFPLAAYQAAGNPTSGRAARLLVTLNDEHGTGGALHCRHDIAATVCHEAFPGHHLHLSHLSGLARPVRRYLSTPMTIEGWAFYSEQIMRDEGFLATPEQEFFQLVALLHRAVRVVLDVGLHTEGMSIPGAVDTLVKVVGFERTAAESEVRRYCASPTYNLAYAVGRRDILQIRKTYREKAGCDFTPGSFHRKLFEYGGLAPGLMGWGLGVA